MAGKHMTQKEKRERARMKKELQKEGILPPDKPKLNRKKFIEAALEEWNARDGGCMAWELYLMKAMGYMLAHQEKGGRASAEAVGAAKVLKLALRIREFSKELEAKGEDTYKIVELYEYVKDILEA